jgi:hypothetical protein
LNFAILYSFLSRATYCCFWHTEFMWYEV